MGRQSSPSSLYPREPWRPSVPTLSPRCRQACTEAAGTQMGVSLSLLPQSKGVWRHVGVRACVHQDACLCVRVRSLSFFWPSLCGPLREQRVRASRLSSLPSFQLPPSKSPGRSRLLVRAPPQPLTGATRSPLVEGGVVCQTRGKAGGQVCRLGPQALATASDTPWAVSSASTLSR